MAKQLQQPLGAVEAVLSWCVPYPNHQKLLICFAGNFAGKIHDDLAIYQASRQLYAKSHQAHFPSHIHDGLLPAIKKQYVIDHIHHYKFNCP